MVELGTAVPHLVIIIMLSEAIILWTVFTNFITATGVLLIVYSFDNGSDVYYLATDKRSEQDCEVNVSCLTETYYGVSVFAIEKGLPIPRVVSLPNIIRLHDCGW